MTNKEFKKGDKVTVNDGKNVIDRPGLIVSRVRSDRYVVKFVADNPSARTKTHLTMRFNVSSLTIRKDYLQL